MFLEELLAMVRTQKLCNSPRGKERKGQEGYLCVHIPATISIIHTTFITYGHVHISNIESPIHTHL